MIYGSELAYLTYSVIELEEGDKEVLLVKYNLKSSGDSSVCCSVQGMRFNVNMPFVKSVMTFLKDSFTTWKSAAPAPSLRQPSRHRHRAARRPNRLNTAGVNRMSSVFSCVNYVSFYSLGLSMFYFFK